MYCTACGQELHKDASVCMNCGVPTSNYQSNNAYVESDTNYLWGIASFFFPIFGLIFYFIFRNDRPKAARGLGIGALVRIAITTLVWMIYLVIIVFAVSATPY